MAQKTRPNRRAFSIQEQLVAKLGPGPFGALLDQLHASTTKPKPTRRRRRRPRRKAPVAP